MKPQLFMTIMLTFIASYMTMFAGFLAVVCVVWLNKVGVIQIIVNIVLNL